MTPSLLTGSSMPFLMSFRLASHRLLGLLAVFVLGPVAVSACEPLPPDRIPDDRPITVYSDGSFIDASDDDGWYSFGGGPARDIGGGRVGQVLAFEECDTVSEHLLVVDCTTGSAILVAGNYSTRALQPPHGPLALTPATTVAEVAALAAREGWRVETDVMGWAGERERRNRFDPFMGCEIFYPGSVGAGR
jgi:hypothetical protein